MAQFEGAFGALLKGYMQGKMAGRKREALAEKQKADAARQKSMDLKIKYETQKLQGELKQQDQLSKWLESRGIFDQQAPATEATAGAAPDTGVSPVTLITGKGAPSPAATEPESEFNLTEILADPAKAALLQKATGIPAISAGSLLQRQVAEKRLNKGQFSRNYTQLMGLGIQEDKNFLLNMDKVTVTFSDGSKGVIYQPKANYAGGYAAQGLRNLKLQYPDMFPKDDREATAPTTRGGLNLQPTGTVGQLPGSRPGVIQTSPPPSRVPIPANELTLWFNPTSPDLLTNPPRGTTAAEAQALGFRQVRPNQQEKIVALGPALEVLEEVEALTKKLFPKEETFLQRMKSGSGRALRSKLKIGKDEVKFDRIRESFVALLARAGGEKGALSDGDIKRAKNAFASLFDPGQSAFEAVETIRDILRGSAVRSIGSTAVIDDEVESMLNNEDF